MSKPTLSTPTAAFHPPPPNPPLCFRCSRQSMRSWTRHSNRNGNAGRPFYKCDPCCKFLGFADSRGNNPSNPACECGLSSKAQVSGRGKTVPRAVHYVCRAATCNFYQPGATRTGERVVLDEEMLERLINLRIV